MGTRYKITAPVKGVISTVAGVAFHDSVGETDNPGAVAYFRRHGYRVEEIPADQEPETPAAEPKTTAPATSSPSTSSARRRNDR